MPRTINHTPLLMPVLGRGKHRTPKSGACFMEYASYLAGERWSDHPSCTHASLAALARLVNDCSSDAGRSQLATLIPSVVGLLGDGRRTTLMIVAHAIAAALPVASHNRQRALAAGAVRCLPLFEDEQARSLVESSLLRVPDAARWAERFVQDSGPLDPRLIDRMCDAIIRTAVIGIAEACVQDPDDRMRDLLTAVIAELSDAPQAVRAHTLSR